MVIVLIAVIVAVFILGIVLHGKISAAVEEIKTAIYDQVKP